MSFPPGTEMFQFPGFASTAYGFGGRYPGRKPGWVAPFGDPWINARSRLPKAFRSVPRPSSPLGAKASTRCPCFPRPPSGNRTLDRVAVKPHAIARGPRPRRAGTRCPRGEEEVRARFQRTEGPNNNTHHKRCRPASAAVRHGTARRTARHTHATTYPPRPEDGKTKKRRARRKTNLPAPPARGGGARGPRPKPPPLCPPADGRRVLVTTTRCAKIAPAGPGPTKARPKGRPPSARNGGNQVLDPAAPAPAPREGAGRAWWAWADLNGRPHAYQACALTG